MTATSTLAPGRDWMIKGESDILTSLPRGSWRVDEVGPEWTELRGLYANDLIVKTGEVSRDGSSVETVGVYSVPEHVRELVNRVVRQRESICPCGHSGVRNRGDHYECTSDRCNREFAGGLMNLTCRNCGDAVSKRYVRVVSRDGVGVDCCPRCEDLVRRNGVIKEAKSVAASSERRSRGETA